MASSSTSALRIKPVPRTTFLAKVCASAPDFWTLTKPEVNFLIVIATFTGFYLGCPGNLDPFPFARLFHSLCGTLDRKSTRLNSSHQIISYAVFCLKKKIRLSQL